MALNDIQQFGLAVVGGLFCEQLRGVADGPEWVADFVSNTAGQSTEGSEFQLLGML